MAGGVYTTDAVAGAIQPLQDGRDHLGRAEAALNGLVRGDTSRVETAEGELQAAEAAFRRSAQRLNDDPALRGLGQVPSAADQVRAVAHLAAIGLDLTRALTPPARLARDAIRLKARYEGRPLSLTDGQRLLQEVAELVSRYAAAPEAIEAHLRAAHQERGEVTTTALVTPLRTAYDEVDAALAQADEAYLQYRDVRRVLTQYLGMDLGRPA